MMNSLKKRLKNSVFITAILSGILLILKGFGIVDFTEDIDKVVSMIVTAGIALGVWVDPTTPGLKD
jgi:phi LC3 family holin